MNVQSHFRDPPEEWFPLSASSIDFMNPTISVVSSVKELALLILRLIRWMLYLSTGISYEGYELSLFHGVTEPDSTSFGQFKVAAAHDRQLLTGSPKRMDRESSCSDDN
jgi:hypothetical protein